MWSFRIGCFSSICAVVFAASLLTPRFSWRESLAFLPLLALFGVVQTTIIMRYAATAGPRFQRLWIGILCGAINGVMALAILFGAMAMEPALTDGIRTTVIVAALILPFVVPPILSPRIVTLILGSERDEPAGVPPKGE